MGIQRPEAIIGPGNNLFGGYAYDDSGMSSLVLEAQPPAGGGAPNGVPGYLHHQEMVCRTMANGIALWNATAANGGAPPADGDAFLIRLRGRPL